MSELTDSAYAMFGRSMGGVGTYIKVSGAGIYAMLKLAQFIARMIESKVFTKDFGNKFNSFTNNCNGEYGIYRIPLKTLSEDSTELRDEQIKEIRAQLKKLGIRFCDMPSINAADNSLHICVDNRDAQKFQAYFENYIKANLIGGEMNKEDLISFTDGKTTIISVPDMSVPELKNIMTELNVNFAQLPDLMPDDGETQFRIATADVEVARQGYEIYKRNLMKNGVDIADCKTLTDQEYLDTAKESAESWMETASQENKDKLAAFNQLEPSEQIKEIKSWERTIRGTDSYECQALMQNMAYSEIVIDANKLIEGNTEIANLNHGIPNMFFTEIPNSNGAILALPKSQVFRNNDNKYLAFVCNTGEPKIYKSNGTPDVGHELFKNTDELLDKFEVKAAEIKVPAPSKKSKVK